MASNKNPRTNKMIKKISKTTFGRSVDTVADYIDLFSQIVVEYFDRKYKIQKKVEDVKIGTINALYGLKKAFIGSIVEAVLLVTGILALLIGLLMFLSNYINTEYILIAYGLIISIGVLLKMKVNV